MRTRTAHGWRSSLRGDVGAAACAALNASASEHNAAWEALEALLEGGDGNALFKELTRLRAIAESAREEHAARTAWLATLPARARAPTKVVASEATTQRLLAGERAVTHPGDERKGESE